jgi:hypothetical protein
MKLQILYEADLLSAAAHIFAVYAAPIAAYFMVGMALVILVVEILDGLGIIAKVSHFVET